MAGHTSDGSEFWHVYGNETEDGYIGIDFIDGLNQVINPLMYLAAKLTEFISK